MRVLGSDALVEMREMLSRVAPERDLEWLRAPKNLAVALSVVATGLLQPFQWLTDTESAEVLPDVRERVAGDLADMLVYLILLADKLNVDLTSVTMEKIETSRR